MATLWDEVRLWLTDATKTALKEAEDLTQKGRLKMTMASLHRKIEREFTELGGLVYHLMQEESITDFKENQKVTEHLSKIKELEKNLKRKERELKTM